MRDTIIFSGASHTFGLGLEWELDPELNSEEYLQKGINLPISRPEKYQKYWRENRWATLVCNKLGYKQYNVHDAEHTIKIGGNSVETIFTLVAKEELIQSLLLKTKYVILEIGHIRWYDEKLHGGKDGYLYPNTIMEMIEVINNPRSEPAIVAKTLDWIKQIDPDAYMQELYNKISYLIEKYTEINFLILPWHSNRDSIDKSNILAKNIIPIIENNVYYMDVNSFLEKNKIQAWHKAKAWNGNYKYNMVEQHASIEGHRRVADIVINHIKKLENEEK